MAAYVLGTAVSLAALGMLIVPQASRLYAKGPANAGHTTLVCTDCHKEAPGTVRQQIQAKVQFWLGLRRTNAPFGHAPVGNEQCVNCHAREQDAHPVHRFLEPRFAEARTELGAQWCVNCHREHKGTRVTMTPTSCSACHRDIGLKREPLDVSHRELAAREQWSTCLGCHDYHGNHKRVVQTRLEDAIPIAEIIDYFNGKNSPYGPDLKYPAKTGVP
jgi:hypothetical protein